MSECDICGESPATKKIRMDNSVLTVCERCTAVGTIIETPKERTNATVVYSARVGSEEVVVQDFGKLIAQARQKTGLNQEEIATKLNEKLSVMQAAEAGKRLDIKLAKKLEKFFGIKLVEIV